MVNLLKGVVNVKALSNVVSVIILMVILLAVFVPTLLYFQALQSGQAISSEIYTNYAQLRGLQSEQVEYGHPTIYYNGSELTLEYSNGTFVPPQNLTIVGILYLNPQTGVWTNITSLKYPISVSKDQSVPLPSYAWGQPIIVVTSLGNTFFLTPGSSIGPYSGVIIKKGTIVIAQICQNGGPLSVSTNVTTNIYGTWENITLPTAFPNQTGTFAMKVPEYVYYENSRGQIVTGVFHNWKVIGVATLNTTTSNSVQVTLGGSNTVIIANYSELIDYDQVQVKPSVSGEPINLSIDGKTYTIKGPTTLNLSAGFAILTVITTQFNSTPSNGVIHHYSYSNVTYDNNVYNTTSMLLFLPPNSSPTIYVNYVNDYNYYNVTIKWEGGLGYNLIYNYTTGKVYPERNSTYNGVTFWYYPSTSSSGSTTSYYLGNEPYWEFYHAIAFNGTVYQYNQSIWLRGGTYVVSPLWQFNQITKSYNSYTIIFNFTVGATVLKSPYQNYTGFPAIVTIDQPITIVAIYSVTEIACYV